MFDEDEKYAKYIDWLVNGSMDGYLERMEEHQQEVEEYPLFFWRSTCKEIDNDTKNT